MTDVVKDRRFRPPSRARIHPKLVPLALRAGETNSWVDSNSVSGSIATIPDKGGRCWGSGSLSGPLLEAIETIPARAPDPPKWAGNGGPGPPCRRIVPGHRWISRSPSGRLVFCLRCPRQNADFHYDMHPQGSAMLSSAITRCSLV